MARSDPDWIQHGPVRLPRGRSNQGMRDDTTYLSETMAQIDAVRGAGGRLDAVLDFGSGQGRLLNGLVYHDVPFGSYSGLDVNRRSVAWCIRALTYPLDISFAWYNQGNARYNEAGRPQRSLPVKDGHYSLVFANSVFSHLDAADAATFAGLLRSAVAEDGLFYLTAFTEIGVPDCEVNPDGYMGAADDTSPLHRVRFEKAYFVGLLEAAGWRLEDYRQGSIRRTGQTELFLSPS